MRFGAGQGAVGAGAVAAVLCLGGCGSGSTPSSAGSAGPSAPLQAADLERAAIVTADVPGYGVEWIGSKSAVKPSGFLVGAEPAACETVGQVVNGPLAALPEVGLTRAVGSEKGSDGALMSLYLYSPASAAQVLPALRAGLSGCTTDFSSGYPPNHYRAPRTASDPHLGDESVAFEMTSDLGTGDTAVELPERFVVVRSGNVIASFHATAVKKGETPSVPLDVVKAQLAKLRDTAG